MTLTNGEHYIGEHAVLEERRTRVMELRVQGWSLRQIAGEVGVSLRTVQNDIEVVFGKLNEQQVKNAQVWRAIHMQRLEALYRPLHARFQGTPEQPGTASVKDAEAILKILEREAKLLGLDITAKIDINLLNKVISLLEMNGQDPKAFLINLQDELLGRPAPGVLPAGVEPYPDELESDDEL